MKNRITLFILALLVAVAMPVMADQYNQRDPNVLVIPIGTFSAGEDVNGDFIVRMPAACKITAAYFFCADGIAKDATDTVIITLSDDGNAIGSHNTSSTAVTANVPLALTLTSSPVAVAADSLLKVAVTHGGSGKAATDSALIIHYYNGN